MWINSLIAGAGGQIVDQDGDVKVDDTAKPAAEIISKLGKSSAAPPGHVHQRGGPGAPGLRVGPLRLPGQLPVRLPERGRGRQGLPEEHRLGALPAQRQGQAEPAAARRHQPRRRRSTRRRRTWRSRPPSASPASSTRSIAAELGGLPPTTESVYDDRAGQEGLPVRRPAARVDRGRRAAARDARPTATSRWRSRRPSTRLTASIPTGSCSKLKDRIEKAVEGKIF